MIPPTRQNAVMYSSQFLNNEGIAICTFLDKYFVHKRLTQAPKDLDYAMEKEKFVN